MSTIGRSARKTGAGPGHTIIAGLLCIVSGTAGSIALIPDDPGPAGALWWPAAALALGLLGGPLFRIATPALLLRAENILMIGLVYWLLLDPLQSAYGFYGVTRNDVVTAFLSIGLMAIAVWIGAAGKSPRPPKIIRAAADAVVRDSQVIVAMSICFFLGTFYYIWSAGFDLVNVLINLGKPRFAAVWDPGALGDWTSFLLQLTYFGFPLPALAVILAGRRGWLSGSGLLGIAFSLVVTLLQAQGGGRRIIGMLAGSALMCWLLLQQRLGAKQVFAAALTCAAILAGLQLVLITRNDGFAALFSDKPPQNTETVLRVDDNLFRLTQIAMLFPAVHPYVGLLQVEFVVVRPIPRAIWPGKPVDPGYDLAALTGVQGATLTTSIVGELYASFGYLAVAIGGIVMGRIGNSFNSFLGGRSRDTKAIVYALGVMTLFVALRSMTELVLMSYGLMSWCIVVGMLKKPAATNLSLGGEHELARHWTKRRSSRSM